MTDSRFRVGYLDRPSHQSFLDTAAQFAQLEINRGTTDSSEADIAAMFSACHGYYARSTPDRVPRIWHVGADFLGRFPNLLIVVTYAAGFDLVDVDACTAAGVVVVTQTGGNAEGVAEHTLGMMLTLLKRIPEAHAALRAGGANKEALMGRELAGRTVGIVGLGHIGSRIARFAKTFGCRVLAVDPYLDEKTCAVRCAEKTTFETVLAQSDIVTLHCPLTHETRGMFGAQQFSAMRKGSLFISTARGSIHDEAALHAALLSGHLAGAGVDVWEKEPPAKTHPLLSHPAVIATPHTAGVTHESRERVGRMAAEAFAAVADGDVPPRMLNPAALKRYSERWSATFGRSWPGNAAATAKNGTTI